MSILPERSATLPFFGDTFQFYRERANLSRGALADKLGVSRSLITRWETGKTRAPRSNLDKVEIVLGAPKNAFRVSLQETQRTYSNSPDALIPLFPAMRNKEYGKALVGDYVGYSLLMHKPDEVSVSPFTILEGDGDRLTFTSKHRSGNAEWPGTGLVMVVPPCVFLVGSFHEEREDPFMASLLFGTKRGYGSDALHGVVLASSLLGRPSATRFSLVSHKSKDRHIRAQHLRAGNISVKDLPTSVRIAFEEARVIQGFMAS
jgi:transcriptional regulator with XRE-family HTH domain